MIVLDTHILFWWTSGDRKLSTKGKRAITKLQDQERSILVSSISAWEVGMLVHRGRLTLNMDVDSWVEELDKVSHSFLYHSELPEAREAYNVIVKFFSQAFGCMSNMDRLLAISRKIILKRFLSSIAYHPLAIK